MTGLLKKDLYVSERSSRLLLVLALVLSLVPKMETFGNTYAMMLAFMMPMNAVAYDERCKWDRYAAMLPYREELLEVFADFAAQDGHAVLLSSHIVSDLERICDYIAFLHKGRLVLCEEKDVLLDRYGILKCTKEQLQNIPAEAVHGKRIGTYGAEALVERDFIPRDLVIDRANLEDIILFVVKEERQ